MNTLCEVVRCLAGSRYVMRWLFAFIMVSGLSGSEPQEVAFAALIDGSTQRYLTLLPDSFTQHTTYNLLIALHGHGSDRWQFMRPSRSETRAVLDFAAKNNLILVSPDYRAPTSWMGPAAEADLTQIITELKSRYRTGKLILVGASMGGTSALTYSALHPSSIDGVVAMNGTANHLEYEGFQDAIQASFGGSKAKIPLEYKNRSAEYWPERLTMPVAITVGDQDTVVPPHSALRLGRILEKLGRQVLIIQRSNGGHDTNYEDATAALEFVLAAVKRAAK